MSEAETEDSLREIFAQDYQTNTEKATEVISLCDDLNETLNEKENTDTDFYLHIIQNIRMFLNCEFFFLSKSMTKALTNFQKLHGVILKTQNDFPDYYSKWEYDIDRLLLRIEARTQNARALVSIEENDTAQADLLFNESIKRYTTELELEQSKQDYYHYFDSLRNIYYVTGLLYKLRGEGGFNTKELFQALRFFRKARFLGHETSDIDFNETKDKILSFRLHKLEKQAELYFESGLVETQNEHYKNAMSNYNKSAQVYNSLKKLKDSVEYELQEQIQMSSYYEVLAKDLISKDNNELAARNFQYAQQTLHRVLEKIPSEELKNSFKPQIQYFDAMHIFYTAVVEYDQMKPEAIDHFNEASEKLTDAKEMAESLNNIPLIESCTEAINKLSSYQDIVEIMFQPSDSEE
ncbi:MAG: hypothetical protein ACXABI_13965 [Candidatus Hodarchaeales archaeon]|jgi:hypothetical protein